MFLFVHEAGERDRRRVNADRGELVLLVALYRGLVYERERKRERLVCRLSAAAWA